MNPLQDTGIFLVQSLLSFYTIILLLRFLLQLNCANPNNPLIKLLITLTRPVLYPLQKILPRIKRVDLALVLMIIIFGALRILLPLLIVTRVMPPVISLMVVSLSEILNKIIYIYIISIIAQALLSWFPQMQRHPIQELFLYLNRPVMMPIQRIIPAMGGARPLTFRGHHCTTGIAYIAG